MVLGGNELPALKSNFLSRLFYCWIVPIIRRGSKQEVTQGDIHPTLPQHTTEELGRRISELWQNELRLSKPSLCRTLIKMFGIEFCFPFFALLIQQCILRTSIPILLGLLIRYVNGIYSDEVGYMIAGVFVLVIFLCTVIYQQSSYILDVMGMRIRVSLVSLTYDKALRLSQVALAATGVGQLTNLISNDVNRFDRNMTYVPYIVACPVQMVIVTFVLWSYTGPASLVGIFFIIMLVPVTAFMGKWIGRIRTQVATMTDKRIRLVTEILNGMLLLKMCTWEEPYRDKMTEARSAEIQLIQKKSKLQAVAFGLFKVSTKISILLTFLTYILTDVPLNAESAFVTLSMFNVIASTSVMFFPSAMQGYSEMLVSIARIQNFLLLEEKKGLTCQSAPAVSPRSNESIGVKVMNLSASWSDSRHPVLSNVSLTVDPGDLVGVIGPVGSGKSTLLQAILGELPADEGTIDVQGQVAYASQEPCFFEGSIKENILFGRPFEPLWYAEVVEACALSQDLETVIHGDETLVGDKGVNLSGGQKARINLARAAYSKASILLLDDPLSAVDVRVARHLMDKCIRNLFRQKCVILVTHQTHYLQEATEIISLEKGEIVKRGTFDEVCGSNGSQENSEFSTAIDDIILEEDSIQFTEMKAEKFGEKNNRAFGKQFAAEEKSGLGQIPWSLYLNYIRTGNSVIYLSFAFCCMVLSQVAFSGSDLWVKSWTDFEQYEAEKLNVTYSTTSVTRRERDDVSYFYLGVYAIQVLLILVLCLVRPLVVFNSVIASAETLHGRLFSAILRAPMRFFEVNSVGRILNRFSNDMGVLDEWLPQLIYLLAATFVQVFGSMIVAIILSPVLAIPALVLLVFVYFVRRFYVSTSARFRRLEGISRSPVFAHFNTTLVGIPVIRAQRAEDIFRTQFISYQNIHTSNFYTYLSASRWFQSTTELLADVYASAVILYFVLFSTSASALGLAVSNAVLFMSDVRLGLQQSADIVNEIVSVERVMDYTNVKPEAPLRNPSIHLSSTWLGGGEIRFDEISVAYENGIEVLQDINLNIRAGEKIGIVGRTGAGKSSLIASLFRIVEPARGKIYINIVDICQIGLHDLRSQLAIIPQSPMLFSGSIRQNLDPFHEYPDSELWNALEAVQLDSRIRQNTDQNLDLNVSEGGSNFSHGEKQLICLARTILRKSKILILDEATANIDTRTDGIIQETLRRSFMGSTVLTIAHRLDTVMDSDRILVLDSGKILEFDAPSNLLQNQQSFLYKLVLNTGPANAEKLRSLAAEAERRKREELKVYL